MKYKDFCDLALLSGANNRQPATNSWDRPVDGKELAFWTSYAFKTVSTTWQGENSTEVHSPTNADKTIDTLLEFIDANFPDLTYVRGKRIDQATEDVEYTDNDWYSSSDRVCHYITVEKLYEILVGEVK
jgi:hypothetical protein